MKEAEYYKILPSQKVQCMLCPHNCIISINQTGKCRVRKNVNGKLYALNYGLSSSISLDPIEKKPLYHFYPGKMILSIGCWGCNFKCGFCQNWTISQQTVSEKYSQYISPQELLSIGLQTRDNIGISYTYNEPLINIEFVKETAILFNSKNLKNVLVTNGFVNKEPLLELLPYIDAANIDLKSFNPEFYEKICGGKLKFVLQTIELMVSHKKHVELTTLIIPGYNDNKQEIEQIINYVSSLSKDIPLHFSRYYPQYEFDAPPTPINVLQNFYSLAKEKLNFVYLGNVPDEKYNSTYCPKCNKKLITRIGYDILIHGLEKNFCKFCGNEIKIFV